MMCSGFIKHKYDTQRLTEKAEERKERYPECRLTRIELPIVGHAHTMTRPLNELYKITTAQEKKPRVSS